SGRMAERRGRLRHVDVGPDVGRGARDAGAGVRGDDLRDGIDATDDVVVAVRDVDRAVGRDRDVGRTVERRVQRGTVVARVAGDARARETVDLPGHEVDDAHAVA